MRPYVVCLTFLVVFGTFFMNVQVSYIISKHIGSKNFERGFQKCTSFAGADSCEFHLKKGRHSSSAVSMHIKMALPTH